ncbi:MAG: phosphate ABC transporter permease subunit PstC [Spirochaetaceae bacterium]|nr:phosphate ABC transporter permease subunit PstC [Myxococcales bacterium]MCB9723665.1 phosphate ABC transporter permease subunit PstC [Spirochaetaceae bacterium]
MIEALWGLLPLLAGLGFVLGRRRAEQLAAEGDVSLNSLPQHYGQFVLLWAAGPPLALLLLWALSGGTIVEGWAAASLDASGLLGVDQRADHVLSEVRGGLSSLDGAALSEAHAHVERTLDRARQVLGLSVAAGFALLAAGGLSWARSRVTPGLRARNRVESALRAGLFLSSCVAIATTIGIVGSLLFEAIRFFGLVSPAEFFFGTEWSPQTALRADQVGSSGAFGAVPVFAGTLLITGIAMAISIPVGLMAAIQLAFYAGDRARAWVKPLLEVIAGIPTVVWGAFAALVLGPRIRVIGESLGLDVASESALAAGLVMGVMIVPFVSSLSDDALNAVPRSMLEGSLAMGATLSETIRKVMVPAALPGIVGAFLLAVSRAIGETMIVVMAAGQAARLTANPFEAVTTVTVQIMMLLVGDQEFDSAKTLAAFALGLTLFFVTLALNLAALSFVRRFREQYD